MNPVHIITGPVCSGKTTLSIKLADNKEFVSLSADRLTEPKAFDMVTENTFLIIIEELNCVDQLDQLLTNDELFEVKRPRIAINFQTNEELVEDLADMLESIGTPFTITRL